MDRISTLLLCGLAALTACAADPAPVPDGAVPITEDEVERLSAEGEFVPMGDLDPAAEAERRRQRVEEAEDYVETVIGGDPIRRARYLPDIDPATERADGTVPFDALHGGSPVALHGRGTIVEESASVLRSASDPANWVALLDGLEPRLPALCRDPLPSSTTWDTLDLEALKAAVRQVADCLAVHDAIARVHEPPPLESDLVEIQFDADRCAAGAYDTSVGGGNDRLVMRGGAWAQPRDVCGPPAHPLADYTGLVPFMSPIGNQATRGTCVAFATASALEYSLRRHEDVEVNLSEQFLFSVGKLDLMGESYGDGLDVISFHEWLDARDVAIARESRWGYNASTCRIEDDGAEAYANSCRFYDNPSCSDTAHQMGVYLLPDGSTAWYRPGPELSDGFSVRIDDPVSLPGDDVESLIFASTWAQFGGAAILAFNVTDGWRNPAGGFVDEGFDEVTGGHAVQLVGVVPHPEAPGGGWVVVKNSWSCGWGDGGYAYFSIGWAQEFVRSYHVFLAERTVWSVPPSIEIDSPTDALATPYAPTVQGGHEIELVADVSDDNPDCCEVTWWTERDGPLGTGERLTAYLDGPGKRRLFAEATDRYGMRSTATVTLELNNDAPEVEIVRPPFDEPYPVTRVPVGVDFLLDGEAIDPNKVIDKDVPCDRRAWFSDGQLVAIACATVTSLDTPGLHEIRHTGEDAEGAIGEDIRQVVAMEWNASMPPFAEIVHPMLDGGSSSAENVVEPLEASVHSGTDAAPEVRWILVEESTGEVVRELGQGVRVDWRPNDDGVGNYLLRLEVSDAAGTTVVEREYNLFQLK